MQRGLERWTTAATLSCMQVWHKGTFEREIWLPGQCFAYKIQPVFVWAQEEVPPRVFRHQWVAIPVTLSIFCKSVKIVVLHPAFRVPIFPCLIQLWLTISGDLPSWLYNSAKQSDFTVAQVAGKSMVSAGQSLKQASKVVPVTGGCSSNWFMLNSVPLLLHC